MGWHKSRVLADADPDYGHSIGHVGKTPVLILAMSVDKRWRAVARMRSFAVFHWTRMVWGKHAWGWLKVQTIARIKPQAGMTKLDKLRDFTLEEHQAVIRAMHRRMREIHGRTTYHAEIMFNHRFQIAGFNRGQRATVVQRNKALGGAKPVRYRA